MARRRISSRFGATIVLSLVLAAGCGGSASKVVEAPSSPLASDPFALRGPLVREVPGPRAPSGRPAALQHLDGLPVPASCPVASCDEPASCEALVQELWLREDATCRDAGALAIDAKLQLVPEETHWLAHGLFLSGALSRLAYHPPIADVSAGWTREQAIAFVDGPMKDWVIEQARPIERISLLASSWVGPARGVVALEAALAELRFIEAVRAVPIPQEMAEDEELRETYAQNLERILEARKSRARDAALVGLEDLVRAGMHEHPRVTKVRDALSDLYGGGRLRLISRLMVDISPGDPGGTEPEARARDRLQRYQVFLRAVDVDESLAVLGPTAPSAPLGRFLFATAIALRSGLRDARELMVQAPDVPRGAFDVRALDLVASEGGPYAGQAAYNAALIREFAAPVQSGPAVWQEIAARYRGAAARLQEPTLRAEALARANVADKTALAARR